MAANDISRAQLITDALAAWSTRTGGAAPQPSAAYSTVRASSERVWDIELGDASGVLVRGEVFVEAGRAPVIQSLRAVARLVD